MSSLDVGRAQVNDPDNAPPVSGVKGGEVAASARLRQAAYVAAGQHPVAHRERSVRG